MHCYADLSRAREEAADDRPWLHPDGLFDDASTVAVGVVGGVLVAVPGTALALFATTSGWSLLAAPLLWIAVAAFVARTRTAFGAVRKASYLVAATLVVVPLFWFTDPVKGGTFGGRVLAFVASEVVLVPLALLLVGFGYWVGGKAPAE